ncbi:uncharacterized protein EV422DRAFT_571315 [Fimicolochytrium jonesii]|uniref:uncharacterized protein n=1 Tax=Fimicolochytrium jonesii TaxID=1396493 RepID=UPI0022FEA978|nr:uncharacterized protein EV422DRAFT_571315 [Fimicolochytrium jonesii]KAI8816788.1 hypothetical protein EV422DRAFT_571315 [Fimicolochytrium jonesii]
MSAQTVIDRAAIAQAEVFVKQHMANNDPSHDWCHVDRVRHLALHIARNERRNADVEIDLSLVELAALLHDVGDAKYQTDSRTHREVLMEFLNQNEVPSDVAGKVCYVVENVSFRKELQAPSDGVPEAEKDDVAKALDLVLDIVRDADKLDAMGAIGIARCMAFSGARGRVLHDPTELPAKQLTKGEYDNALKQNKGAAINHFYEKLFTLKDRMRTETGKEMAQTRHEFMQAYVAQFLSEWDEASGAAPP